MGVVLEQLSDLPALPRSLQLSECKGQGCRRPGHGDGQGQGRSAGGQAAAGGQGQDRRAGGQAMASGQGQVGTAGDQTTVGEQGRGAGGQATVGGQGQGWEGRNDCRDLSPSSMPISATKEK